MNISVVEFCFYWLFPIVSIVYVIVYSEIFKPIRDKLSGKLGYLFQCPICMGAWVGIGIGIINIFSIYPKWIQYPALGLCAGIAINFLLQLANQSED